jgi:hypothetical protein
MEQLQPAPETPPDWEQLRPVLDDAMSELDDTDRDAVLLRYFKNHDLRTVGATLGISDDAAQKRVSRAVERLREFFAKRGVTVGASGLSIVISANAVQAAPVGLALTISTAAALTGTTLATTATVTATKAIAMTTLQKTIVTATIAVLAGASIYEARQAAQLREQVQILEERQTPLVLRNEQLSQGLTDASNQLASFQVEIARLNRNTTELLRLRGEIAQLRSLSARQETNVTTTTIDDHASLERENQIRALIKKANNQYVVEGRLLVLKNRLQLSAEQVSLVRQILEQNADDFSYADSKKLDPNIAAILTPDQKVVAEQAAEAEWTSSRLELAKMCAEDDYRRLRFCLGVDESQKALVLPILEAYGIGMQQLDDAKRGATSARSFWSVEEDLRRQKINGLKGILSSEQYEIFRGNEEALIEAGRLNYLDR